MSKKRTLLRDQAYSAIKEAILNEEFKPGELLSEKVLIDYLGMSKTPIKSALDRLEAEGFVYVSPKQGILVLELSSTKVHDIFQLRIALEQFVCQQLAGKLSKEQQRRLEENLAKQEQLMKIRDEKNFTHADADFHLLLCEFSGNEEIYKVMNNYQAHLYRFALHVTRRVENRMEVARQDHEAIYRALVQGDAEEAQRLIKAHLLYGQNVLAN